MLLTLGHYWGLLKLLKFDDSNKDWLHTVINSCCLDF